MGANAGFRTATLRSSFATCLLTRRRRARRSNRFGCECYSAKRRGSRPAGTRGSRPALRSTRAGSTSPHSAFLFIPHGLCSDAAPGTRFRKFVWPSVILPLSILAVPRSGTESGHTGPQATPHEFTKPSTERTRPERNEKMTGHAVAGLRPARDRDSAGSRRAEREGFFLLTEQYCVGMLCTLKPRAGFFATRNGGLTRLSESPSSRSGCQHGMCVRPGERARTAKGD